MKNTRKLILIVNDDGIMSPGLLAAANAVEDLADLLVAAPLKQQTGMGRAFARTTDTGIITTTELLINGNPTKAYGVCGTPAFSVAHAVLELADRKPDLCISGINYGENLGTVLTCSGTLGAAFEAVSYGIPAIAVSQEIDLHKQHSSEFEALDFTYARNILNLWVRDVLEKGLPEHIDLLNINIPSREQAGFDYRITTQSRHNYIEFIKPEKREFDKPYALQSKRIIDAAKIEKESDIYAVFVDKTASVTPLNITMSVPMEYTFT